MAFDENRYEQEVIRPLRGQARLPEGDLVARYAIEPSMTTEAVLQDHLRRIRTYWNQNSHGAGNKAKVCRLLMTADEELARQQGPSLVDPSWWRGQEQQQARRRQGEVSKLADNLKEGYGGTGRVTREQLEQIRTHLPGLSEADVAEAVRLAGLTIVDAVELPTASGLDPIQYAKLKDALAEIGAATIVQLLYPGVSGFQLLRGLEVAGQGRLPLDRATLDRRRAEAEAAANSAALRARKSALGVLATGVQAGADLKTVALYQIVEQVRAARARIPAPALLVRTAVDMGLAHDDAELLVLSLPAGSDATPASPADHVSALMDEGQLRAAQQALGGLPADNPATAEVRARVEKTSATVERCVRDAASALAAGREDEARRLLLEAHNLARDDEDIELRLRSVPVGPPRAVVARPDGAQTQLSWTAPSGVEGVRYRVVRADAAVASPDHGTLVAEVTTLSTVDKRPPLARELYYTAFASADGTVWSRPASCSTVVIPPIRDLVLRADPERVTGSWAAHPELASVVIRRGERSAPQSTTSGTVINPASRTSFVDSRVTTGVEYFYQVWAVYRDVRGREIVSEPVLASATPRAPAVAVTGLQAQTASVAQDVARIRLRWPASADLVRIRYADRPPSWGEGSLITAAEMERYGREATGTMARSGLEMVLEADVVAGQHVFVPFSVGGTGVVVGRPIGHGVVEGVRQLTARRLGDRTILTWVWPPEVRLVEVAWQAPDGQTQVRRITRAEYNHDGGCVVTAGRGVGTGAVRAVAHGSLGEVLSPPAHTAVQPQELRLSYRISRPAALSLRRGQPWQVVITVDGDCAGVDLSVVVAAGLVVPLRIDQGTEVQRFTDLRLAAGIPLTLDLQPPRLRRPFWIKCFITRPASVQVTDPPIDEMKVH